MRARLHLFYLVAFAVSNLAGLVISASADELDDLQRDRESAEINYVNELATGNYKTAAQQESLRKKLLEPHENRTRDYFKKISKSPSPRPVKPEEVDITKAPPSGASPAGAPALRDGGTVSGHSAPSSAGVQTTEKAPLRPEFVLDGSNVPKEITFGTQPSPSPKAPAKKTH